MRQAGPRPSKPWDVGDGCLAATVGENGQVISVHRVHPRWGWVHLSGLPPFDEGARFDPEAVRAYRRLWEDPRAPGLQLQPRGCSLVGRSWRDGAAPEFVYRGAGVEARCTVFASHGRLYLWLRARPSDPGGPDHLTLEFRVRWGLCRAAYGQITEGGPLPPADCTNRLKWTQGALVWEAPGLPAWGWLYPVPRVVEGPLQGLPPLEVCWREGMRLDGGGADRVLVVGVADRPCGGATVPVQDPEGALSRFLAGRRWETSRPRARGLRWFVRRQLLFVLDACSARVGDATCLMTDPVVLPLSWNRDAYYMACLLGAAGRMEGALAARARNTLAGHLRWLFRVARRPSGWWGRSHLAGGAVKDGVFQLDQQWYPVLEAARAALDWGLEEAWREHGHDALRVARALLACRHENGLWASSETPADDPLQLPYHFSSHVLAWRTLRLLGRLDPSGPWDREAIRLREAVLRFFTTPRGTFAYATDGHHHLQYHDANDLPLACAAGWGFVSADDPVWRRTLEFAWSPQNAGYFPGSYGGLGSTHAPGPWTLGDLQDLVVGGCTGDRARLRRAWRRLAQVAFDDGLLCESYDPQTGRPRTRAWFAWPGAAAAALLLGDCL